MALRIAVMSDLHCRSGADLGVQSTQTYLTTDLDLLPAYKHPIEALKILIERENLNCDLLICPGDISDKMDKNGLFFGWNFIKEIQDKICANSLYATTGNHDVDSRKNYSHPHPFDIIKQLKSKNYPTSVMTLNDKYWLDNYCIDAKDHHLILIFNSSYSHINDKASSSCVITLDILQNIDKELQAHPININQKRICLLHHHPDHHSNFDLKFKDADFVENGDKLIELLAEHSFDIVIHGHKHEPKLRSYNKIPIFASGSFSSIMNIVDIKADNTFHIITLEDSERKGQVETWAFSPSKGWSQEQSLYFPSITGFGATKTTTEIANECNALLTEMNVEFMYITAISEMIPDIKYLMPYEQKQLEQALLSEYSIAMLKESSHNLPHVLIRQYGI